MAAWLSQIANACMRGRQEGGGQMSVMREIFFRQGVMMPACSCSSRPEFLCKTRSECSTSEKWLFSAWHCVLQEQGMCQVCMHACLGPNLFLPHLVCPSGSACSQMLQKSDLWGGFEEDIKETYPYVADGVFPSKGGGSAKKVCGCLQLQCKLGSIVWLKPGLVMMNGTAWRSLCNTAGYPGLTWLMLDCAVGASRSPLLGHPFLGKGGQIGSSRHNFAITPLFPDRSTPLECLIFPGSIDALGIRFGDVNGRKCW